MERKGCCLATACAALRQNGGFLAQFIDTDELSLLWDAVGFKAVLTIFTAALYLVYYCYFFYLSIREMRFRSMIKFFYFLAGCNFGREDFKIYFYDE